VDDQTQQAARSLFCVGEKKIVGRSVLAIGVLKAENITYVLFVPESFGISAGEESGRKNPVYK
jgi:hypothetical protein